VVDGFDEPLAGPDGFTMPATQHDAVLWVSGSAYDVVFDVARAALRALAGVARLADETSSWPYQHDRDLTGFIDGSENPTLAGPADFVLIPSGPGAGGTILLVQKWTHDAGAWEALSDDRQEQVIGRRKADSVELDDKPDDSHVARTDNHGTMFVGFCAEQQPLADMLENMAGLDGGPRDALTRYNDL
jgi:porphyrinogen peroxidase